MRYADCQVLRALDHVEVGLVWVLGFDACCHVWLQLMCV